MLSTTEAFAKFRSRLELNDKEQADASSRQKEIRSHVCNCFSVDHDFLTGSYKRHTKTKPLKDVDIFFVLGEEERKYRKKAPGVLLSAVEECLAKKYERDKISKQRRSVSIDFGVTPVEDRTDYRVVSFDVVAAFSLGKNYEIPDVDTSSGWTTTNPRIHEEKAVAAQDSYDGEWKGLVRMMKYWNNHHDKPITPSFLIEVMALDILHPPFGGDRAREIQGFFATLGARIHETWDDPAGLGPPVSDSMTDEKCNAAADALRLAEREAAAAMALTRQGQQGDALKAWRRLFGPLFPLS